MKQAIYFTWNDGTEDSFNVYNAQERVMNINEMLKSNNFSAISYCKIYASGEYGKRVKVL